MRTAIIIGGIVLIALAGYLVYSTAEMTPEEARRQKVEQSVEETKEALQGVSDSIDEAITTASDAAKLMATEWQSDIEDAFAQTNAAVTDMSEEALLALHEAVNTALEDAAVVIAEKSSELETASEDVRQELRAAVDKAVAKAAKDIADGSASIEQASKKLRDTIQKKAAKIE